MDRIKLRIGRILKSPEWDSKYPPWQTVYSHFRQFKLRGIWEEMLDKLIVKERVRQQRQATPSLLAIDSQSVKAMLRIAFISIILNRFVK